MVKPHVAFLPSPGLGHIIPLFEMAKRLVIDFGFQVSFLVITTEASAVQNQLFNSSTLPPDFHVVHIPPADMSAILTDDMRVVTRICVIVQESLKQLRSILLELNKPKALVIDLFCTQAFEVCKDLSIPVYSFFTASSALLSLSIYLPKLDQEVEGEFIDLPGPVQVPGCNPVRTEDLLDQVRDRKNDEYKWYLLHLSRLPLATGIFANTWEDLEPITLLALKENTFYQNIPIPPVYPIGPLIKQEDIMNEKDGEILTWLDNQPPDSVLFVVFGSGGTLSSEQLNELAFGLENSQQRFILVARKPTDASASAAYLNVGSDENDPKAYLPDGFAERTKGRGLIVPSWAPEIEILRHASTGGFLSHCGWNSTLESVAHGVPMIAWPLYAEQRMNATILAEQVGVAVKPVMMPGEKVIGRKEIERVVRLVMEGDEGKAMREKARALKKSAEKALNNGGSSFDALNEVVKIWKSETCTE